MHSEKIKLSTSITFFYSLITFSIVFSSLFLMKTLVVKYTLINYSLTLEKNYIHSLNSLITGKMKGQTQRILSEFTLIYGDKVLSDPYGITEKIEIPTSFPSIRELPQGPFVFVKVGNVSGKDFVIIAPAYQLKTLEDTLNFFTILFSVFSVTVVIGIGLFFSRKTLKPLKNISKELEEVRIAKLDKELPKQKYEEFQHLVNTLNSMLKRLKEGFERQEQFISDASHELRTPISAILANLDMLLKWGKEDGKILDESLQEMRVSLKKLNLLVNSLLELSRGKTNISVEEFDAEVVVKEVIAEVSRVYPDFEIDVIKESQNKLKTDREKLKEILTILLDNAIKYSGQSRKILIHIKDSMISVKDFGVGISQQDLKRIFDRFYRLEKSRTSSGFGLGLSIAKKLANLLRAEITVTSEMGKGSEFTIHLTKSEENHSRLERMN